MNQTAGDKEQADQLLEQLWQALGEGDGLEVQQVLDIVLWLAASVAAYSGVEPQQVAQTLIERVHSLQQPLPGVAPLLLLPGPVAEA